VADDPETLTTLTTVASPKDVAAPAEVGMAISVPNIDALAISNP
jgi:hypothetical protein